MPDGRIQFGQVQVTDPGVTERRENIDVQAGPLLSQRRLRASSPVPLDPVGHQIPRRQPSGADSDDKRSGVKVVLTSNRRRRSVENDEYASFIRRILRAYSRRVADGDVEALSLMASLADELDAAIAEAVKGLRACGYSWAEIGSRLDITRQAAQQRWGTS